MAMVRKWGVMFTAAALIALLFATGTLWAKDFGTAGGYGKIERFNPSGTSDWLRFSPRYSYAYDEDLDGKKYTWIVLTEKEPRVKDWMAAKDHEEARRLWCEQVKTPFAAVQLDPAGKVNQYLLCPANGTVNLEMLSSWNGLDSVVLTFESRDDKKMKGAMRTGQGSCPDSSGAQQYCDKTGEYTFDTSLAR